MKRDLSVIRYILKRVEDVVDFDTALGIPEMIDDYLAQPGKNPEDGAVFYASFKLLQSEKFILTGQGSRPTETGSITWDTIKGITWRGYNLIDAIDSGRALEFV